MSNTFILTPKNIPDIISFHNAVKTFVPQFEGFLIDGDQVTVLLNTEVTNALIVKVENIVPPSMDQLAQVKEIIKNAALFGSDIIDTFAAENVLLGVTQDRKTKHVRVTCREVKDALETGSLYDAIDEIKLIATIDKDPKYLSNARLTIFCNKIEDYLGIAHTTVTDILE